MLERIPEFCRERMLVDRIKHENALDYARKLVTIALDAPETSDPNQFSLWVARWIYERKGSEENRKNIWAALSAYSNWYHAKGFGPDFVAPVRGRMKFRLQPVIMPPSLEDIRVILAHIMECAGKAERPFPHLRYHAMVVLDMYTGMRRHEITQLRRRDLCLDEHNPRIQFQGKCYKTRTVPLVEPLRLYLQDYLRGITTDYIFPAYPDKDTPIDDSHFSRAWKAYKNGAGYSDRRWRLHDVRHAFGTHCAEQGMSPLVLRDLLGHSTLNMTMRYVHVAQTAARAELERVFAR